MVAGSSPAQPTTFFHAGIIKKTCKYRRFSVSLPCTAPRNQINDRCAGSNFLNWCVRRQFAATNNMATVDKPVVDTREPSVLALAGGRPLLAAARDYKDGLLLPYVALSLFAGLRPWVQD